MSDLGIAVIGAGIIGRTHIRTISASDGLSLRALVDPAEASRDFARSCGVPHFSNIEDLVHSGIADAAIIASPNETHVSLASTLLEAGIPVLLEKPVASTLAAGQKLVAIVERTGTPLLVGHHRRHNPIIKASKQAIENGEIGDLVTATVNASMFKPDDYFVAWRTEADAGGPLLINLIHEIDLLRHFFGEIRFVQAMTSNSKRGLDVEDTAGCVLEFERSGMATMLISDTACGPWAWDISAGEVPDRFPTHEIYAHTYSGTKAGLSLPDLSYWRHPGSPDWTTPMQKRTLPYEPADPFAEQLKHFLQVIRNAHAPLVSCAEGVANMAVVEAIKLSAREGRKVHLSELEQ